MSEHLLIGSVTLDHLVQVVFTSFLSCKVTIFFPGRDFQTKPIPFSPSNFLPSVLVFICSVGLVHNNYVLAKWWFSPSLFSSTFTSWNASVWKSCCFSPGICLFLSIWKSGYYFIIYLWAKIQIFSLFLCFSLSLFFSSHITLLQLWLLGSPSDWVLWSFNMPPFFCKHSLTSGTTRCSKIICVFPAWSWN